MIAASLPVLSALVPKSWTFLGGAGTSTYGSDGQKYTNHTISGGKISTKGGRSTKRTSISGRKASSDSIEAIMRTDGIEMNFHRGKSAYSEGDMKGGSEREVSVEMAR